MTTLESTVEGSVLRQSARWKLTPGLTICLMATTAYVLVFFWLQVRLYEGFHMGTRDLVLFDQALYNTLRGDFFKKTIESFQQSVVAGHDLPQTFIPRVDDHIDLGVGEIDLQSFGLKHPGLPS